MKEQLSSPASNLPEMLESVRLVGQIPAESLPWIEADGNRVVDVRELVFPDGNVYLASAGTPKLNKISSLVQNRESPRENGYTELDSLLIRGCHMEANGTWRESKRVQIIRGQSADYDGFQVKDIREGNTANASRIYYASTPLRATQFKPLPGIVLPDNLTLMIRLGITDKQHQLDFLGQLTYYNRKHLKRTGAGSI